MPKKIIIIGGGIIGLSIGYFLAKRKSEINEIVILDKSLCGQEASWAAAGMLRPQSEFEDQNLLNLCLESIKMYPQFSQSLLADSGININYKTHGTIILALDDEQLKELNERYEKQKSLNLKIQKLSSEDLKKLSPNICAEPKGAVFIQGDHWADNLLIVQALIKSLKKLGAKIHENCEVFSYIEENNSVTGVETSLGKSQGNIIVNSAGSWTSKIKSNNQKLIPPVKPILGQIIAVETPDWLIKHNVCTFGSYLASRDKNTIIIGSTMEDVGFEKRNTVAGVIQLLQNASKLVPKISECKIIDMWSGLRPTAPDNLPILGKTSADGLIIATATYRNGILLTPIVGKTISELIIDGKTADIIKPFGIGRFYAE